MVTVYGKEDIDGIKDSCLLLSKAFGYIKKYVKAGTTLLDLDRIMEDYIVNNKGTPAFKGYKNFPGSICTSLNEEVVHGIPNKKKLKAGDVISIDCGVCLNGYYSDSAYTFAVGKIPEDVEKLLRVTKESLYKGIEQAKIGNKLGDIGAAIQKHVEENGFSIIKNLTGHGLGRNPHEPPEILNFGEFGTGKELQEGWCLAIEPMVSLGSPLVRTANDGWTIITVDRKMSSHYEHTIVVGKDRTDILTTFDFIESS